MRDVSLKALLLKKTNARSGIKSTELFEIYRGICIHIAPAGLKSLLGFFDSFAYIESDEQALIPKIISENLIFTEDKALRQGLLCSKAGLLSFIYTVVTARGAGPKILI